MANPPKIADQTDRRIKLARFVRNVSRPEWGLGIVLTENDAKITAFFERAGGERSRSRPFSGLTTKRFPGTRGCGISSVPRNPTNCSARPSKRLARQRRAGR